MAITPSGREYETMTDDDIDNNILNLCRCGTYFRMRKAIHRAATLIKEVAEPKSTNKIEEE